jgi:hypothetical protein
MRRCVSSMSGSGNRDGGLGGHPQERDRQFTAPTSRLYLNILESSECLTPPTRYLTIQVVERDRWPIKVTVQSRGRGTRLACTDAAVVRACRI